jgi:hypothetical protein
MSALGLLILVDYYYQKDLKILSKNILYAIVGFIGGVATVLVLMFMCGHWEIFKDAITLVLSMGGSGENSHSIGKLINTNIGNYITICKYLVAFVFTTVCFAFLFRFSHKKWMKIGCAIGYSILILFFVMKGSDLITNIMRYYAIILFPLIASYFVDYRNKTIILLNTASLIILFFLPLGSDFGVGNMGYYSIWLATFVSAGHIYRYIQYQINTKRNYVYLVFGWCFFTLYIGYGVYAASRTAYGDSGSRLKKCYRANNDKFSIFTTTKKVDELNKLLSVLNKYVQKNDYLLCFESLPMVHYLTDTRPYVGTAWPWVYDSEIFKFYLEKSIQKNSLPVVLRHKKLLIWGDWVDEIPDEDSFVYNRNRVRHFENFLLDYNYKLVWENDLFAIHIVNL